MVFIIQNTHYRDSESAQIKLDEIICALKGADNIQLDLEDRPQEELDTAKKRYSKLAKIQRNKKITLKTSKSGHSKKQLSTKEKK